MAAPEVGSFDRLPRRNYGHPVISVPNRPCRLERWEAWMRRTLAMIGVLVVSMGAFGLLVGGGAGVAAPRAATITDITFREGLCDHGGAHCKVIKAGKDFFSYGTRLIFTIPLYQGKTVIGKEEGECVNLQRASHSNYCTYNLTLQGGTVSVQGTLTYNAHPGTIPITGGIDAFEGAYGYIHELNGYPARYTLHIITP